jgi:hypothetical protein
VSRIAASTVEVETGESGFAGFENGAARVAHTDTVRQAFAHDAVVDLTEDADDRALGGAVTVALCGSLDHEPPCPVAPHHTSLTGRGARRRVRVLFATEDEPVVRRTIEAALGSGTFVGPDGTTHRWVLRSSASAEVADTERAHAARLLEGVGS